VNLLASAKRAKQRWAAGEPPAPPTVRTNNRCNPSFYRVPISCIHDFWYSLHSVCACATNCQVVVVCLSVVVVVVGMKAEVFLRRPAVCSFVPQVIALLISRWAISLQQMVAYFAYSSGCLWLQLKLQRNSNIHMRFHEQSSPIHHRASPLSPSAGLRTNFICIHLLQGGQTKPAFLYRGLGFLLKLVCDLAWSVT